MKLVTGIEAIQSGKPWKHHHNSNWINPKTKLTRNGCPDSRPEPTFYKNRIIK